MGNLFGTAAGTLMIMLIVVLLFKFISDTGVKYSQELLQCTKKYTLWGMGFFVAMYLVGGLVYSFNNPDGFTEEIYVFDIGWVWDFAIYTQYEGIPSLYNLLVQGFSAILFGQSVQCALYISLLCAVITCTSVGVILDRTVSRKSADRSFLLLMCAPLSYLIFMPGPYAMFIAMFTMFMALIVCEKKMLAVIPALIACVTHINGILLIMLWIMFVKLFSEERFRNIVLLATTCIFQFVLIIVYIFTQWGSMEENIFTLVIPVILLNSEFKLILSDNVYKIVILILALFSGFFMCGNIYGGL